jgi:hypothetical protein
MIIGLILAIIYGAYIPVIGFYLGSIYSSFKNQQNA